MAALVWVMMGLAVWHFTVFLPDHFKGGIVGAFVGALVGSFVVGLAINGFSIPGQDDTTVLTAAEGIPGGVIGLAVTYWLGRREERRHEAAAGAPAGS